MDIKKTFDKVIEEGGKSSVKTFSVLFDIKCRESCEVAFESMQEEEKKRFVEALDHFKEINDQKSGIIAMVVSFCTLGFYQYKEHRDFASLTLKDKITEHKKTLSGKEVLVPESQKSPSFANYYKTNPNAAIAETNKEKIENGVDGIPKKHPHFEISENRIVAPGDKFHGVQLSSFKETPSAKTFYSKKLGCSGVSGNDASRKA